MNDKATEISAGDRATGTSRRLRTAFAALGMLPKAFRAGGPGMTIRFAVGQCWLGAILVATSEKGICGILLGDDPTRLTRDLQDRFPKAELIGGDRNFERLVAQVVGFVAAPAAGLHLPQRTPETGRGNSPNAAGDNPVI